MQELLAFAHCGIVKTREIRTFGQRGTVIPDLLHRSQEHEIPVTTLVRIGNDASLLRTPARTSCIGFSSTTVTG